MVYLKIERLCTGLLNHTDILPCPLVGFSQRVGPPVCPVHLTSVQRHSKGMWQVFMSSDNFYHVCSIIEGRINSIWPRETSVHQWFIKVTDRVQWYTYASQTNDRIIKSMELYLIFSKARRQQQQQQQKSQNNDLNTWCSYIRILNNTVKKLEKVNESTEKCF